MRNSIVFVSRSLLFTAVFWAAAATATVPTEVTISGQVTGLSSQSIQIDGVAHAIEPNELTRAELADIRVGDSVTIAISGRVVNHEIKVRVVHAPNRNQ
jgi:hypothetical protein